MLVRFNRLVLKFWTMTTIFLGLNPVQSQGMEIKVLTFNVWGMRVPIGCGCKKSLFEIQFAPSVGARMQAICETLEKAAASGRWDYVLLQEAWSAKDRKALKNCGYRYSADLDHFRIIQAMDSGLMILSRYPILDTKRITYSLNGSWKHPFHGECFTNKGAILAKTIHPQAGYIWLATSHLVSNYGQKTYSKQRSNQFFQFFSWAKQESQGEPLILGGDFNVNLLSHPEEPNYEPLSFYLNNLPGFARWNDSKETWSNGNDWNPTEGTSALYDVVYGSENDFIPVAGGLALKSRKYLDSISGEYHLSDHYGYETTFEHRQRD